MNNDSLEQYDLEYELEGIERFNARAIPELYQTAPRRTRSLASQHTARGVGHQLISACTADTMRRYETLFDFEALTRPCHDHGFLIGLTCQIVESEISRLLAEPAREIGEVMLSHLDRKKKKRPREYLQGWLENRIPTMIGVQSFILMALRYALDKKDEHATDFVNRHFRERYPLLLSGNKLGASLDTIKNNFRNPACHGTRAFGPEDYRGFVLLCMGAATVREWDHYGPKYDESIQENAVFLNHLTQAKAIPLSDVHENSDLETGHHGSDTLSVFQRLMRMAGTDTMCHVEVQPCSTARAIHRDMTFCDAAFNDGFHLNSKINIGYYYTGISGAVEVTLFDLGTTGKLTVLMPDDILSEGRINWFPDAHRNQSITLTNATGLETVFAIATQREFDLRGRLNLDGRNVAREFAHQDTVQLIGRLTDAVAVLPDTSWALGEFAFEIEE